MLKHEKNIDSPYKSFITGIVEFGDEEGIMCSRCNIGIGHHSCWRAEYDPESKVLDSATVRRLS